MISGTAGLAIANGDVMMFTRNYRRGLGNGTIVRVGRLDDGQLVYVCVEDEEEQQQPRLLEAEAVGSLRDVRTLSIHHVQGLSIHQMIAMMGSALDRSSLRHDVVFHYIRQYANRGRQVEGLTLHQMMGVTNQDEDSVEEEKKQDS